MKKLLLTLIVLNTNITAFCENISTDFEIWKGRDIAGNVCNDKEYDKTPTDIIRLTNVSVPTLKMYKADSQKPTGFVIVCPGGGYNLLSYDAEGMQIAKSLQDSGISSAVLKYRVPNNKEGALMDIERAIKLARFNAKEWNIDPKKIAVIGFSAGANLCARASTLYKIQSYKAVDAIDEISSKPDLAGLVYSAYCDSFSPKIKNGLDYAKLYSLNDELKVDSDTPPTFIVHPMDDKRFINSSIAYFLALKEADVAVDMHIYNQGGHGIGLGKDRGLISGWIDLFKAWLKSNNF